MAPKENNAARYEQILLLGCDVNQAVIGLPEETQKDRCERSDTIIVLSLDKMTGKIVMIDLARDTWVPIPGHGMGKLNAAVWYCGPETAVNVINDCFDLCIRKYVQITINDLVDLVDQFGGVDLSLTAAEVAYINEWMPDVKIVTERNDDVPPLVSPGMNHLNGMQTLAHVRNRSIGYSEGRENRANNVLKSMARKAKKEMSPQECLRFALKARSYVTTGLNASDIAGLLRFGLRCDPDTIAVYHAPAGGTYKVKTDSTWRMETDFKKASRKLRNFLDNQREKETVSYAIYSRRAAMGDFCRLEDVSDRFITCLLLFEDHSFYRHNGIDVAEIARAVRLALKGNPLYGGSTITQQLVKNLYFRFDRSYLRKIKEAFLSRSFERELTKRQILELYMNVIYFDNGQYGIYNASRFYFHKDPKDLDLNQSVFLAALLPVVGIYNPLYHPKEFAEYRNRKLAGWKGYFTDELVAEILRHGPDLLDEELCKATEETKRYDAPGPMINERFGPGGPDRLIR